MDSYISSDDSLSADYKSKGQTFKFRYYELANYSKLDPKLIKQVYGVCFYQDKMVIVYDGKSKTWGLVGGGPEEGESVEDTLKREILEESNMQLIRWRPIGVQEVTDPKGNMHYELRVACKVRPNVDSEQDSGGGITEVKLIDPQSYTQYFDWGEIGKRIVQRAIQLKPKL